MLASSSIMTTQSTIFQRHLARHPDAHSPKPSSFELPPQDAGLAVTFSKFQKRSTIYHHHELRHAAAAAATQQGPPVQQHQQEQHSTTMKAVNDYGGGASSLWSTLADMGSHSTIHNRNERRVVHQNHATAA